MAVMILRFTVTIVGWMRWSMCCSALQEATFYFPAFTMGNLNSTESDSDLVFLGAAYVDRTVSWLKLSHEKAWDNLGDAPPAAYYDKSTSTVKQNVKSDLKVRTKTKKPRPPSRPRPAAPKSQKATQKAQKPKPKPKPPITGLFNPPHPPPSPPPHSPYPPPHPPPPPPMIYGPKGAAVSRNPVEMWEPFYTTCANETGIIVPKRNSSGSINITVHAGVVSHAGKGCYMGGAGSSFTSVFGISTQNTDPTADVGTGVLFFFSATRLEKELFIDDYGAHFGIYPFDGTSPPKYVWGIEMDTYQDVEVDDIDNNHIGVNFNSAKSAMSRSLNDIGLKIAGSQLTIWVEYSDLVNTLEIRVSSGDDRPYAPFISMAGTYTRNFLPQALFAGFGASGDVQGQGITFWLFETINATNAPPPPWTPPPPPPPGPPSPPPPPVGVGFWVGFWAKLSWNAIMASTAALMAVVFLILRVTKCGQARLLKWYAKVEHVKWLQPFFHLGICLLLCSIKQPDSDPTPGSKKKKRDKKNAKGKKPGQGKKSGKGGKGQDKKGGVGTKTAKK